jgi:hypothetical protein
MSALLALPSSLWSCTIDVMKVVSRLVSKVCARSSATVFVVVVVVDEQHVSTH